MAHQGHVVDFKFLEPGVQVAGVIRKTVGGVGLPRAAHADQVRGQAAGLAGQLRDHVSPQVRRRRIAVQEDDRVAVAVILVVHRRVQHRYTGHFSLLDSVVSFGDSRVLPPWEQELIWDVVITLRSLGAGAHPPWPIVAARWLIASRPPG
jgi:hypothetical protein